MTDIVRRDPFQSLFSFPRWVSDLDDMLPARRGLRINETDKELVVKAVVAGIPAKDVNVHIEDGVLTIKAEKTEEAENEYKEYQYYYTAALSGGQWDKAEAEVEDGIVTIVIPKTEAARPRSIEVKAKAKQTK